MNSYQDFELEDFLCDEFFMEWVLHPKSEYHQFWDSWLVAHPEKAELVNSARSILQSVSIKPIRNELSIDELASITANFEQQTRPEEVAQRKHFIPINLKWIGAVAAVLLCAIAIILYNNSANTSDGSRLAQTKVDDNANTQTKNTTNAALIKMVNGSTQSKLIALSDGSLVILKPNSTLSYQKTFSAATRDVYLSGEAFFDIHKNRQQPFLVHSGTVLTKVLGTSFTVSAYPGNHKFKVLVNTGRVEVSNYKTRESSIATSSLILMPDEQAVLNLGATTLKKQEMTKAVMLSPKIAKRIFAFSNTPFPQIVAKLEDAYGVNIIYDQSKYASATITASLSNLPLQEKIRAICTAIDATYEITDTGFSIK